MSSFQLLGQSKAVMGLVDALQANPSFAPSSAAGLEGIWGNLVHAYLIEGAYGTGKYTLARWCAQAIYCTGEQRPCGVCPSCVRFAEGNHPDVHVLEPERSIGVDDVRELISAMSVRPYEGVAHVALIRYADKMTVPAQNALLKTLENPPRQCVFFLMTARPVALLPTVVSRCRVLKLLPLSPNLVARALCAQHGVPEDRADVLAQWSHGSVGQALDFYASGALWQVHERVLGALAELEQGVSVARAAAPLREEREHAELVLDTIEQWLDQRLLAQDARAALLFDSLMQARQRLASNVSWQSVVEMLFFDLINR